MNIDIAKSLGQGVYTKAEADNIKNGKVLNFAYQYDSATRSFNTSWSTGMTFNTFNKSTGSDIVLMWRVPFRNDDTGWGGGYLDIQLSIDGGNYESIGDSGYDGGVMNNGASGIGSMSGTTYLDLDTVRNATSIQVRFVHRSYNGTVIVNGSHDVNTGTLGAFWTNLTIMEIGNE